MTQKVEFPGMRYELIKSIEELSDFEMQKEKWVRGFARSLTGKKEDSGVYRNS